MVDAGGRRGTPVDAEVDTGGRRRTQRWTQVDAAVDALEMQARIVKPAQRVEAIAGLDLDSMDAQLQAVPMREAAYGTLSAIDARKRAVNELERRIRALAAPTAK